MNIVDPMHNMFLGTAKRMFKTVWVEEGLLNLKHLETIQTKERGYCSSHEIKGTVIGLIDGKDQEEDVMND